MIVNPVNSVVPAMAELYKKKGLDPMKIVGITTLDVVRANKFVGESMGKNPNFINIPVIGGHAGETILPLFSQDKIGKTLEAEKIPDMDKKVQDAGTVVVNARMAKAVPRSPWPMRERGSGNPCWQAFLAGSASSARTLLPRSLTCLTLRKRWFSAKA